MRQRLIGGAIALASATSACAPADPQRLTFWGMGGEGEKVEQLLAPFRAAHPEIHLEVQGIPFSSAHDKLLTAYAGDVTPDVCQLGSTWVPELAALHALAPLDARIAATPSVPPGDFFQGAWDGCKYQGQQVAIPWYVETRALFYRTDLLKAAGFDHPPATWPEFLAVAKAMSHPDPVQPRYGVFLPTNPFGDMLPLWIAWQQGGDLVEPHSLKGQAQSQAFEEGMRVYRDVFANQSAPLGQGLVANLYQAFADGTVGMFISGPWNASALDEKQPQLAGKWAVAPLPGIDGHHTSIVGGSVLTVFKRSKHQEAAWQLVSYLSQPEVQTRFYALAADLPARKSGWTGARLAGPVAQAFFTQLQSARPAPPIPEWEQVAAKAGDAIERVVYSQASVPDAAKALDAEIELALEKRRWLNGRHQAKGGT